MYIGQAGGLDFHPISVDPADATFTRNVALELPNVSKVRVYNTAFWLV